MNIIFQYKKAILIALTLLIVCYFIYSHFSHHTHLPAIEPIEVEVTKVKTSSIAMQAHAVGTLSAAKSIQITPEFEGQVAKILVKDGSFVTQGTPLLQLDDTVNKTKYESAKANLQYAQTDYDRKAFLGKKGAISQQIIDQAFSDLKNKKAAAEESRIVVEKMRLVAPFDGTLGKVLVSPGEHVTANTQIVSLTDTHHLRVNYNLSEKYLTQLKLGQKIKIVSSNYPDKIFIGKVAFISPTINTEDRTLSVYAKVPNKNGLLTPGLFVNVTQSLGALDHALLIPAISLVATIDGNVAYKVVDGKAVMVPVTIGQRTDQEVQITQGLLQDDIVVTLGLQKIKEGMPVKVKT